MSALSIAAKRAERDANVSAGPPLPTGGRPSVSEDAVKTTGMVGGISTLAVVDMTRNKRQNSS